MKFGDWPARSAWPHALLVCLGLGAVSLGGCKSRPVSAIHINRKPAAAKVETHALPQSADVLSEAAIKDKRYQQFVRPLLTRRGCDSGQCHGTIRGGGLYLAKGEPTASSDYKTLMLRLDRKDPEKSELVQKALNLAQHNGGKNLDENSCDYKKLIAWIGEQPDPPCQDPPPPDRIARFTREVAPALMAMGCADKTCHGGEGKAMLGLNLSSLVEPGGLPQRAAVALQTTQPNHFAVFESKVIRAVEAKDGKHKKKIDPMSCAYRRLYGFIADAPEASCELTAPGEAALAAALPSFETFRDIVLPQLQKRGCVEAACHGGGSGDMSLFPHQTNPASALHDYLQLTSRIEDLAHPETSTFLRTARNQEPHGGGKRLGGRGDCIDDVVMTWLGHKTPRICPPPQPPSYERFVAEIQPTIDKMTCSNKQCHGGGLKHFVVMPRPTDPQVLRANYQEVTRQIDYDFMPLSPIQLRMREPCAYSVVGAWIEGKPKPSCVVHDPDPRIFPRRDADGNVMHPKVEAGPPPATKT